MESLPADLKQELEEDSLPAPPVTPQESSEIPVVVTSASPIPSSIPTDTEADDDNFSPLKYKGITVKEFVEWVPEGELDEKAPLPCLERGRGRGLDRFLQQYSVPTIGGARPRYFNNVATGRGRLRPGLGTNLEDFMAQHMQGSKRKKSGGNVGELKGKRIRITREKPAAAFLNDFFPNVEFTFHDDNRMGDTVGQQPSFLCSVTYPPGPAGEQFTGEGRSKKQAKNDASLKILRSEGIICDEPDEIDQSPPHDQLQQSQSVVSHPPPQTKFNWEDIVYRNAVNVKVTEIDFSSDDIINDDFSTSSTTVTLPTLSQPMVTTATLSRLKNIPNFEENITLVLNTLLFPTALTFRTLSDEGPPHDKKFQIGVIVNDHEFVGEGGSKKKAKAAAAKLAVISLLGIDCYTNLVNNGTRTILQPSQQHDMPLSNVSNSANQDISSSDQKKKKRRKKKKCVEIEGNGNTPASNEPMKVGDEDDDSDEEDSVRGEYDLNFSDHISNIVREKFEELLGSHPTYSNYKVLAGVVLTTTSPMIYNSEVIAVTTGTKCIEGDYMSPQGLSVNDCHAEILATRCLRDYLYSQIELLERNDEESTNSILQIDQNDLGEKKYKLKENIKFHLYISTSPCGDARIFSPKGLEIEEEMSFSPKELEDSHPNKINRGVLRSKIEAGEGTIPSANLYSGPQTWDSIVSGNALYTMSCSDKICRWNVLGLQGSLLYNLVGALHYSSIVLGSLHHPVHFKRAVYGRIEPLFASLPIPFRIHKPKLMMVSREEKRVVKKSPNHAVAWSANWSTPEVLAASKGRCEPGGVASRLAKRMVFGRFLKLYKNNNGRRENYVDLSYYEAKMESEGYQKAKEEFISFFNENNLGPWIGKPLEQDSFKIVK